MIHDSVTVTVLAFNNGPLSASLKEVSFFKFIKVSFPSKFPYPKKFWIETVTVHCFSIFMII